VFLKVRSPSTVNYKLKCSPAASTERGTHQGPFTNTVRTPTDKSVWGIKQDGLQARRQEGGKDTSRGIFATATFCETSACFLKHVGEGLGREGKAHHKYLRPICRSHLCYNHGKNTKCIALFTYDRSFPGEDTCKEIWVNNEYILWTTRFWSKHQIWLLTAKSKSYLYQTKHEVILRSTRWFCM
jgi:hypothetical protein